MKTLICTYRKAQLFHHSRDGIYLIRADKNDLHPYGIDDHLGWQPIPSEEEAIKRFKSKIDKHIHALQERENFDDILKGVDPPENAGLVQWESDKAFDGGGDFNNYGEHND